VTTRAPRSRLLGLLAAALFFGGIAAMALPALPGSPWVRVGMAAIALGVVVAVVRARR
jgi:hypothetical protein